MSPEDKPKKAYIKPTVEKVNEKVGITSGAPPVPGAPAASTASPVAPGMTVF